MTFRPVTLAFLAIAFVPATEAAADYVGVLKPPAAPAALAIPEPGFYWRSAEPALRPPLLDDGFQVKLGYRYSKYLALETGYSDSGPASPLPGFVVVAPRSRGFSMDTVGTLPLWGHASLYGRLGAWRADAGISLLGGGDAPPRPGAGLRYGLGLKYDLTRAVGLQAEMERFSPIDRWGPRESDTDQFTLGVRWRF